MNKVTAICRAVLFIVAFLVVGVTVFISTKKGEVNLTTWAFVGDLLGTPPPKNEKCLYLSNVNVSSSFSSYFYSTFDKGSYPHQQFRNSSCPQYLTGSVHQYAGLGHKSFNFFALLTAAQHLELRYLHQQFPSTSEHTHYDNSLANWLGFSQDEYLMSELNTSLFSEIKLPPWDSTYQTQVSAILREIKNFVDSRRQTCNVIFILDLSTSGHFLPFVALNVKRSIVAKYEKTRQSSEKNPSLTFDLHKFNIAIHYRNGDIVPTSIEWLAKSTDKLLDILLSTPFPSEWNVTNSSLIQRVLPIQIHLFAFYSVPIKIERFPSIITYFGMPLDQTLYHLVNADVVVRSASSFADLAATISHKPLFVHPPTREWGLYWDTCYPGGICLGEDTLLDSTQISDLLELKYRWMSTRYR